MNQTQQKTEADANDGKTKTIRKSARTPKPRADVTQPLISKVAKKKRAASNDEDGKISPKKAKRLTKKLEQKGPNQGPQAQETEKATSKAEKKGKVAKKTPPKQSNADKDLAKKKEKVAEKKPPKQSKADKDRAKTAELEADPDFQRLPDHVKVRILKSLTQRMFLIHRFRNPNFKREEFGVSGSTGNVYKVVVSEVPSCTCVDFRMKRSLCKHLLFVFLRVLRIPKSSPIFVQKTLSQAQLEQMFDSARPNPVEEGAKAPEELRKAWEASVGFKGDATADSSSNDSIPKGKRILPQEGDSCPVCYEDLEPSSEEGLVFCSQSCGRPVHDECFQQWKRSKASYSVTCIWCRALWPETRPLHHRKAQQNELQEAGYGIGMAHGFVAAANSRRNLNLAEAAGVTKKTT